MLLTDFLKQGTAALESLYPAEEAHGIVLMLCEEIIGTKSYTHIVEPQYQIDRKWEQPLARAMERLGAGEPIQYVLGKSEFCGRTFRVTPDVLIPRPETELLVKEAVKLADMTRRMRIPFGKSAEPVRVLDLCTGSGCIAWSVALAVPGARVVGVDISDKALEVARSQDFSEELKETGAVAPTSTSWRRRSRPCAVTCWSTNRPWRSLSPTKIRSFSTVRLPAGHSASSPPRERVLRRLTRPSETRRWRFFAPQASTKAKQ